MAGELQIDLVPHLDAGDRSQWPGDQDQRPLSELGRRQAALLCAALAAEGAEALLSSPALRCVQTLEPLADRLRLPVTPLVELRETDGFREPAHWVSGLAAPLGPALGGACAAGRGWAALQRIRAAVPAGRVVACSHGDVIPALAAFLEAAFPGAAPAPLVHRGQWYRITLAGERLSLSLRDAGAGFPLA